MQAIPRADGLSDSMENRIEAAYWEFKARMDPTQHQYPTSGERYAFKQAVRQLFFDSRAALNTEDK